MHVIDFLRELRAIEGAGNCGAFLLDEAGKGAPKLIVQVHVPAIKQLAAMSVDPVQGSNRTNRNIEQDLVGAMQKKVGEMLKQTPKLRLVPPHAADAEEFAGQG